VLLYVLAMARPDLMQRLQEQNEEKKQNLPKIAMEKYPIGFVYFLAIAFEAKKAFHNPIESDYENLYNYTFLSKNFHPPNPIV